jgi:predicted RNA-binding Zn-ribbon protein involved in translation (DUF1610 family)
MSSVGGQASIMATIIAVVSGLRRNARASSISGASTRLDLGSEKKAIVVKAQDDQETGSCVSCASCLREIPLAAFQHRLDEFSVPCPSCGRRNLYRPADAHEPRESAKAAKTFGTARFATDKTIEQTPSTQPASWLNECRSWLLR